MPVLLPISRITQSSLIFDSNHSFYLIIPCLGWTPELRIPAYLPEKLYARLWTRRSNLRNNKAIILLKTKRRIKSFVNLLILIFIRTWSIKVIAKFFNFFDSHLKVCHKLNFKNNSTISIYSSGHVQNQETLDQLS